MSLDERCASRGPSHRLSDAALADRYRKLVGEVQAAWGRGGFERDPDPAVAAGYAKLLAYKDEYELRAFTDGSSRRSCATSSRQLQAQLSSCAAAAPGRGRRLRRPQKKRSVPG